LKAIGLVMPLRPPEREEAVGLDVWEHGEEAYGSGEGAVLILSDDGGDR
jgi:Amt family ammonium transporter